MLTETWPWQGIITIRVRDALGRIVQEVVQRNTIVTSGKNLLRDILRGAVADGQIHYVALGTAPTTLTNGLTSGNNYTSLAVGALPFAIPSGTSLTLVNGATTQVITTSANAASNATSITVTSFTASATFPVGTAVMQTPAVGQTTLDNEQFRKAITSTSAPATGAAKNTVYIAPPEAISSSFVIQEIGWFAGSTTTSAANSGTMIARVLYYRAKAATESVQIDRTDQF